MEIVFKSFILGLLGGLTLFFYNWLLFFILVPFEKIKKSNSALLKNLVSVGMLVPIAVNFFIFKVYKHIFINLPDMEFGSTGYRMAMAVMVIIFSVSSLWIAVFVRKKHGIKVDLE